MRRIFFTLSISVSLLQSYPALGASYKERAALQSARTPAEIEPLITVSGDDLDPVISISTRRATFTLVSSLLISRPVENSFLRGFIDKKTGRVDAQIYHIADYGGSGWHFFERASVESAGGPVQVDVIRLGSDVRCQSYGCLHTEEIAVPIDFELLKLAAATHQTTPTGSVRYRLYGKSGGVIDDVVPLNEIAAFVAVVQRELAKRPAK